MAQNRVGTLLLNAETKGFAASERDARSLGREIGRTERDAAALGATSRTTGLRTEEMGGSMQRASRNVRGLSTGSVLATGALIGLAASLTAVGRNASRVSLALAGAVAETSTLIDGTRGQIRQLTESSAELAATFGGTAAAQAQGYYAVISAGADFATEATDALVASNQLAIGGVAELGAAVQLLTGTQNAFAAQNLESIEISNIFFEVVRNGITTIPQLANSFANVSSIAAGFGVSLQTTGSAIAALTATGTQTTMATTQIRALITAFQNLNEEQIGFARQLGVTSTAPADFVQIIQQLEVGLSGYTSQSERATALSNIFGSQIEALGAVVSLTGGGFDTFNRTLFATENSAGATGAAVSKIADGDAQMLAVALGQIEQANVRIGDVVNNVLIPSYTTWAGLVNNVASSISDFDLVAATDGLERAFVLFSSSAVTGGIFGTGAERAQEIRDEMTLLEIGNARIANSAALSLASERVADSRVDSETTTRATLNAEEVLLAELRNRRDIYNELAVAENRAGLISQDTAQNRVRAEIAVREQEAITENARLANTRAEQIRHLSRLENIDAQVSAEAQLASAQFISAAGITADPNIERFTAISTALQEEEEQVRNQLRGIAVQLVNANDAEQVELRLHYATKLRLLENNNASQEEINSSFYLLQELELNEFLSGVEERALASYERRKAEQIRANNEAIAEERRANREIFNLGNAAFDFRARAFTQSNSALADFSNPDNSFDRALAQDELDARQASLDAFGELSTEIVDTTGHLQNLGIVSADSANSITNAIGAINSVVSTLNAFSGTGAIGQALGLGATAGVGGALGGFGAGIAGIAAGALPVALGIGGAIAILGGERVTGQGLGVDFNDGTGDSTTQIRRTGLTGLVKGFNETVVTEFTGGQASIIASFVEQVTAANEAIAVQFGATLDNIGRITGDTQAEIADSATNAYLRQIEGLEMFRQAGEENIDTARRLLEGSREINEQLAGAGLGGFGADAFARNRAIGASADFESGNLAGFVSSLSPERQLEIARENLRREAGDVIGGRLLLDTNQETGAFSSVEALDEAITRLGAQQDVAGVTASALATAVNARDNLLDIERLEAIIADRDAPPPVVVEVEPARANIQRDPRRIELSSDNFATERERRIAQTTLDNLQGQSPDEERNRLLRDMASAIRTGNTDIAEALETISLFNERSNA